MKLQLIDISTRLNKDFDRVPIGSTGAARFDKRKIAVEYDFSKVERFQVYRDDDSATNETESIILIPHETKGIKLTYNAEGTISFPMRAILDFFKLKYPCSVIYKVHDHLGSKVIELIMEKDIDDAVKIPPYKKKEEPVLPPPPVIEPAKIVIPPVVSKKDKTTKK